jgi:xanthine dehydrogenase YagS FAD-binding subunit
MRPFSFKRATEPADAVKLVSDDALIRYIAGGTNLIDLMKEGIDMPSGLVDISRLQLSVIRSLPAGGVSIGALAKNSDTANHPLIRQNYPMLTQAILSGASPQIRNMATNGGNLMQRTRCAYFYDLGTPCNKRKPGSGCSAKDGLNRYSAILGWNDSCVAVHPSDMCVALAALDAVVKLRGANGRERSIPFIDFHKLPGTTPEKDNVLAHGDLITSIDLPKNNFAANSHYLKIRDRSSYAFALVSAAVALDIAPNGNIRQARIALGGVAHKPWRAVAAEKMLVGKKPDAAVFQRAAESAVMEAKPLSENGYKVKLVQRAIARALGKATGERTQRG